MIIFVGDKPSKRMRPGAAPFEGSACEPRLKAWISKILDTHIPNGIQYHTDFAVVNKEDYHWKTFERFWIQNAILIALGNNASKALDSIPHFKLPHPSGLNRQVNNKEFINSRLLECKKYIESQTIVFDTEDLIESQFSSKD